MPNRYNKKKIRKLLEKGEDFARAKLERAKRIRKSRKTLYPFGFEYKQIDKT
tara:strand:+ start:651 stop:806 length:156 start_codon:yes stop_codon:yes gene_type:complete